MPKLLSSKTTHGVPFLNIKVMMDLSFPSKPAINCTYCPETPNQKWSKIEASLQKQLCSKNTGTILKIFNIICAKNQPTNSSTILLIHFFFYFFSAVYPIGSHFFCISIVDATKSYHPESSLVLDLPTAYVFFGLDPKKTIKRIGDSARALVKEWNQAFSRTEVGRKNF